MVPLRTGRAARAAPGPGRASRHERAGLAPQPGCRARPPDAHPARRREPVARPRAARLRRPAHLRLDGPRRDGAHPGRARGGVRGPRLLGSDVLAAGEATPGTTTATTAVGTDADPAAWVRRVPQQVSHIARDPLDPAFDEARVITRLLDRRTAVKRALLDQGLLSGVGNIYADESLWAARVHPEQPTESLSRARARVLLAEVRVVLLKALGEGGTSFDAQYVNVNGQSGYFSHSLAAYGQQGRPCPRCGTLIVREAFMNRSSHFCPRCQRVRTR
ncbi:DNA-formamidopyrimidine glycosylase [Frigoribacterium sp. VKM Ac-2860]|nr:DNA-formamidopyrimidine glycosylase [Frigoribacterium sp. VKM Ac-2860]NQX07738.1 DNA-formamidopyrimidine glycosylase [Frigoribacterium sp. VKM Ac-2859]